jgi:hypothetical protein
VLVPAATPTRFQDGGGHVDLADVVVGRPPATEVLGEDAEGPLDWASTAMVPVSGEMVGALLIGP